MIQTWQCKNCLVVVHVEFDQSRFARAPMKTISCPCCTHEIQFEALGDEDVLPDWHFDPEPSSGALGESGHTAGDPADLPALGDEPVGGSAP